MKKSIRVAVVGLGRAGWFLHFEPLRQDDRFEVCAVTDPDAARVTEAVEKSGCQGYADLESLLAAEKPDLVAIATPNTLHATHVGQVLAAGCHCVVEKPMASTCAEAEELVSVARARGLKLFVHHQHLFKDEYHHFREVIASGLLGEIFHINCYWGNYGRRWDWQTLKRNGGGQLNNTCPHALSIVLPLLGSPVKSVYADLRNIKDAGDCEDHVHLVLNAESGATADITVTSASALPGVKWMILGRHGSLQSDGVQSRLRYYDGSQVDDLQVLDGAAPGRKYLTEKLPWQEDTRATNPLHAAGTFYDNVAGVLLDGCALQVSPESAVDVTRVIEMAHRDALARSGK